MKSLNTWIEEKLESGQYTISDLKEMYAE